MLSLHILSKCNIKPSNGILFQWINISARLCSSSSTSSDSSDSDSDTEKAKPKVTQVKSASPANATSDNKYDLENFLSNMIQARKLQNTIDVAMQPKKKSQAKLEKPVPFEKKIVSAAEDVANMLGGDKTKTTSDLLEKVLASRVQALREESASVERQNVNVKQSQKHNVQKNFQDKDMEKSIIRTLLDEYNRQPVKVVKESSQEKYTEKKSIIQNLLDDYNKQPVKVVEDSVTRKLLQSRKESKTQLENKEKPRTRLKDVNLWDGKPSQVFENMGAISPNIPELKTWAVLEQRELKAMTTYPPANVFQELILWTEQGKLWKFPIDNEQGMEEEHNVHFSEHVFMERHLKEWCPKSGPVRHFMELVCTGLSKNPYMTVQEKIGHIMWYKEYFGSKHDLLQEIGAIQEPIPDKLKQITE